MKKRVYGKKLSRGEGSRRSLERSLIRSLVMHGYMITTKTRAKFMLRNFEKILNKAKKKDIHSVRQILSYTGNDKVTTGRIVKLANIFADQKGGFVRFIDEGKRKGDRAPMVRLELTKNVEEDKTQKSKAKKSIKKEVPTKKILKKIVKPKKK